MSPATTSPLSRTRSRMSTRPCVRFGVTSSGKVSPGSRAAFLPKFSQGTEIDREIVVGQTKCRLQVVHPLTELHQRQAELFDFPVIQGPAVHPANGLMLEHTSKQFYHGQHEARKTLLDSLRISVD